MSALSAAFTMIFTFITTCFSALNLTAKSVENIAKVAELQSGVYYQTGLLTSEHDLNLIRTKHAAEEATT